MRPEGWRHSLRSSRDAAVSLPAYRGAGPPMPEASALAGDARLPDSSRSERGRWICSTQRATLPPMRGWTFGYRWLSPLRPLTAKSTSRLAEQTGGQRQSRTWERHAKPCPPRRHPPNGSRRVGTQTEQLGPFRHKDTHEQLDAHLVLASVTPPEPFIRRRLARVNR